MLAAKSGDWQYLFRIRRLLRFASDKQKTSETFMFITIRGEMAVDAYYNVYIYTAQVRPFVSEGCALCYIHIYYVGVGGCPLASVLVVIGCRKPFCLQEHEKE